MKHDVHADADQRLLLMVFMMLIVDEEVVFVLLSVFILLIVREGVGTAMPPECPELREARAPIIMSLGLTTIRLKAGPAPPLEPWMRTPPLTVLLALSTACVHRPPTDAGRPTDAGWPTEIREYEISDTSAFPNDLAIAADGSVWYTDRMMSRIGHLDPETGEIRQHRTPTPASAPYGITIAEDGSVWYAGSRAGVLGRLDPSTGTIAEYRVGEGGPHGVVALGDRIWFTMRRSGSYGWLDRNTLEIRRFEFPGPAGHGAQDRGPYALVAGARGSLWFTAMGTGALFRVDTRDGSLRRFDLGIRGWPRRLAVDPHGDVWYGNFPASRLGRLVPSTGKVEEIQLVKRPAEPYGIAVAPDGRVWFNEARNNRVMGYDPATDEFRALVIPTAGAIIRGMAVDMERSRIWLPLSGTHRIGRIDLPRSDEQD